jgi:hypothetical protein
MPGNPDAYLLCGGCICDPKAIAKRLLAFGGELEDRDVAALAVDQQEPF